MDKITVGELVYKISGDMDNLKTELKKSETEITKLKQSMEKTQTSTGKLTKGFGALKATVVGFISGVIVKTAIGLAKVGAEFDSLNQSFTRLSGDLGLSGNRVLEELRRASAGTISNKDLILSANRAMTLGVAKNMEEFTELMEIARLKARDMGLTTTQAFDNIVTGIGRGSPLILDNLGIIIKQEEAYELYAKSLGVATDALTENQKREALKFAVLEDGRKQLEKAGKLNLTYSEQIQRVGVSIENLKIGIGRALLPAFGALIDSMFESGITVDGLMVGVNALGNFMYRLAKAVTVVISSFKLFKEGVSSGFQTLKLGGDYAVLGATKTLGFLGDKLGYTGDAFDNFETSVKDSMETTKKNLEKNGEDILDISDDINDGLSGALSGEGYVGVTTETIEQIKAVADATEEAGGSATDSAEKLKEFQSSMAEIVEGAKATRKALEEDLSKAFKKFNEDVKTNFTETNEGLAEIVVNAQDRIKELKEEIADTDDDDRQDELRKELKQQQEILKSRKDFEDRLAARVDALKTRLTDAGIDTSTIDALNTQQDLEAQIKEQRRISELDEFARFEEIQFKKLDELATNIITENELLTGKIEKQQELENEMTAFLLQTSEIRTAAIDAFAQNAIAKYGEMATELKRLISLQARLNSMKANPNQFHDGGYVGAGGGEVHPGEYVIPANMVSRLSGLVSNLEQQRTGSTINNSKTVNAPISINANVADGLDFKTMSREMAWELGKR